MVCITLLAQYSNPLCQKSQGSCFNWQLTRENRLLRTCKWLYCSRLCVEMAVNTAGHLCFLEGLLYFRGARLGSHISDPAYSSTDPGMNYFTLSCPCVLLYDPVQPGWRGHPLGYIELTGHLHFSLKHPWKTHISWQTSELKLNTETPSTQRLSSFSSGRNLEEFVY